MLAAGGCTLDEIVDISTYHTDLATQFKKAIAMRATSIGEPPHPNWTAVGVTLLAGFDFEIKAIARMLDASKQLA